jgi:hypothetical protein
VLLRTQVYSSSGKLVKTFDSTSIRSGSLFPLIFMNFPRGFISCLLKPERMRL